MATTVTINVRNNSPTLQNLFFFQQPGIYAGGAEIYSNSLYSQLLLPYASSGAILSFTVTTQNFAGAQQQIVPPIVGQPSGQLAAIQAIGLTPGQGGAPTNNTTTMIVTPSLGLTVPVNTVGPQPGTFRIIAPVYNPVLQAYNAGSALQTLTGGIVLSNFMTAQPNTMIDCQPSLKFFVQTGTFTPGTVVNFTSSSATAALCDATPGYTSFSVTYNPEGTWSVTPYALKREADGGFTLVAHDAAQTEISIADNVAWNADIMDAAGTVVIARGYATSFNVPIVVQLANTGSITQYDQYQVGPRLGPLQPRQCIAKSTTTAIFA